VLHAARWKERTQKCDLPCATSSANHRPARHRAQRTQKLAICALSHNFVELYLRKEGTYRQSERNLLNSNTSYTSPHNMGNFGRLTADIGSGVLGTPAQQISMGFESCLRYCSDVAHRRPTKLCTMFGRLLGWYTMCTFSRLLPADEILPGAKFTLRSTCSPILAALLHGTPAVGVRQALVVQGMELRNFRRRRHLCSAGRPSRWASAHILVRVISGNQQQVYKCTVADK